MQQAPSSNPSAAAHEPASRELHLLAERPVYVHFSIEDRQSGIGAWASVIAHIVLGVIVFAVMTYVPRRAESIVPPPIDMTDLIFIPTPGPGGGGGGGGNKMPDPPKKAALPAAKPPAPVPLKPPEPAPVEPPKETEIPAKTLEVVETPLPGALQPTVVATASQGTGTEGGGGTGEGAGIGPGKGDGLGPGSGGNFGGGPRRPGSGVSLPRVVKEVKPMYTAEAMRAKVQGMVWLECIVMPDGSVGDAKVVRSLDSVFGLDQEAIKAARQWKFIPGTFQGQPVPVIITIELTFTLR
jgi:protein TonB